MSDPDEEKFELRAADSGGLIRKMDQRLELVERLLGEIQANSGTELVRTMEGSHAGEERAFEIASGVTMKFCWIPPGEFMMGSPEGEPDRSSNETQCRVTLTHGFWLGKYPVTQAQWQGVMGSNPSYYEGADLPVENVSWLDICGDESRRGGFLGKVGRMAPEGWRYDLPSEAQWEYACRAGTTTAYSFGDDPARSEEYAWYAANSDSTTHPVGQKLPNAWGLHDMHGNVWEWCTDWFAVDLPGLGPRRGLRGGYWSLDAFSARCADSRINFPDTALSSDGFRAVLAPGQ